MHTRLEGLRLLLKAGSTAVHELIKSVRTFKEVTTVTHDERRVVVHLGAAKSRLVLLLVLLRNDALVKIFLRLQIVGKSMIERALALTRSMKLIEELFLRTHVEASVDRGALVCQGALLHFAGVSSE